VQIEPNLFSFELDAILVNYLRALTLPHG
jgi:hypothetical protein